MTVVMEYVLFNKTCKWIDQFHAITSRFDEIVRYWFPVEDEVLVRRQLRSQLWEGKKWENLRGKQGGIIIIMI